MDIAKIIVDIQSSAVDRIFEYKIIDGVLSGCRVLVPFGRQVVEGYCIGLSTVSQYDETKLKTVLEVLDDYPVILPEALDITQYLVEKYHFRYVDIIRLFIPSQMRGGRVKPLRVGYATLNTDVQVDKVISARASAQMELVEFLRSEGSSKVADLNKSFSSAALRSLVAKGIVTISKERVFRKPYKTLGENGAKHELSLEQEKCLQKIIGCRKDCLQNGDNNDDNNDDGNDSDGVDVDFSGKSYNTGDIAKTFLLHGVTGSGKTEVYLNVIEDVLKRGKTAIMLVPEISLTPQVLGVFRTRFGDNVALLHSGLSSGERFDEWMRLREDDAQIAIGARSAIFAPLQNLGVIIIDEEHDSSYTASDYPRYETVEIANFRAMKNNCPLILGSATPSIKSYHLAKLGKYQLLEMPNRINNKRLPPIHIVDMGKEVLYGNQSFLSRELIVRIGETLRKKQQIIIFLNRRGYSAFQQCRVCGYIPKCDSCDVAMVYHADEHRLKCHYCGLRKEPLTVCPQCGSDSIRQGSIGTEQVVEKLEQEFGDVRILRLDNDTTTTKDAYVNILGKFASGEADILVGTQMVAKGHDFPAVTLVGILEADVSLYCPDYHSIEKTYQLITQVSGRAGRAELDGQVVLQTFSPRHYVYKYVTGGDYKSFFEKEINIRETTAFPPFCTLIRILATSEQEQLAVDTLQIVYDKIKELQEIDKSKFLYLKAMHCPIKKLKNKHRVQILIRLKDNDSKNLLSSVCEIVAKVYVKNVSLVVEIDPDNLR